MPFPLRDVGAGVDPARLDCEFRNLRDIALSLCEFQELAYGRSFVLEGHDRRSPRLGQSPINVIGELGFRDPVDREFGKVLESPYLHTTDVAVHVLRCPHCLLSDGHLGPLGENPPECRRIDRLTPPGFAFQAIVQVLSEAPRLKGISRLCGLDHVSFDRGDLEPGSPLGVLVVRPFVKHDPAVTPEVKVILVVGMGPGQVARPDLGSSKSEVN